MTCADAVIGTSRLTASRPGGPGELDRYWVARPVNGARTPAAEVAYGITPSQAAAIRPVLHAAKLGPSRVHGLHRVAPIVAMTVSGHGKRSGWLRDPVITAVRVDPQAA